VFAKFRLLAEEIAHTVRTMGAVLDGEIVCLGTDGRSPFYDLLFRWEWPAFCAFDVLELQGEDLRQHPLIARKRRLNGLLPGSGSRVQYVDHIVGRGVDLFTEVCRRDLEGIVGNWRDGRYEIGGVSTSWLKIKNPMYSQMRTRNPLVERGAMREEMVETLGQFGSGQREMNLAITASTCATRSIRLDSASRRIPTCGRSDRVKTCTTGRCR
jgi:bifunctional non-homologous end joining protein LigD